jgi:hypothetical protein
MSQNIDQNTLEALMRAYKWLDYDKDDKVR